jgi:hypothetical protein
MRARAVATPALIMTRAQSSVMAQTSRLLQSRQSSDDLNFHVITHFVGPADRSDEIGAIARRIIGELLLAWGELVDEGKLPDDDMAACAEARRLIMRGPPAQAAQFTSVQDGDSSSLRCARVQKIVVLMIDAVNMIGGGEQGDNKLNWLPNEEDFEFIPHGIVIVLSTTPGPELDSLIACAKAEPSDPSTPFVTVGPLNDNDRQSIADALLLRHTKRFSSEQMQLFMSNPGSSNPLWQTVAMFRLRQTAVFETLTSMISALPPTVEELLQSELKNAEAAVGRSFVAGLLIASMTARQGLRQSEALLVLPVLAAAMDAIDNGRFANVDSFCFSAQGESGAADVHPVPDFLWARLRSALDAFFLPTMCGAPLVLIPCHNIVRAAITSRYGECDAGSIARMTVTRYKCFLLMDHFLHCSYPSFQKDSRLFLHQRSS